METGGGRGALMPKRRANRRGATSDAAQKSAVLIPRPAATRRTRCSSIPGSRSIEHAVHGALRRGPRGCALLGVPPRTMLVHTTSEDAVRDPRLWAVGSTSSRASRALTNTSTAPSQRPDALFTKIGGAHFRAAEQFSARPADDDPPVFDDVATVPTPPPNLDLLLDQQEAEAPFP